jgi:hypothetical protein
MCTLLYLATDSPVRVQPWDASRPAFHVRAVDDVEEARIRHYTARRRIYYIGTREKCGCPFSYGVEPGFDDSPAQLAERAEAIMCLQELLNRALTSSRWVELIALEATEWDAPRRRRRVRVPDLANVRFAFAPPEVVEVCRSCLT